MLISVLPQLADIDFVKDMKEFDFFLLFICIYDISKTTKDQIYVLVFEYFYVA